MRSIDATVRKIDSLEVTDTSKKRQRLKKAWIEIVENLKVLLTNKIALDLIESKHRIYIGNRINSI